MNTYINYNNEISECLFESAAKYHDFSKGPLILGLACNCPKCSARC